MNIPSSHKAELNLELKLPEAQPDDAPSPLPEWLGEKLGLKTLTSLGLACGLHMAELRVWPRNRADLETYLSQQHPPEFSLDEFTELTFRNGGKHLLIIFKTKDTRWTKMKEPGSLVLSIQDPTLPLPHRTRQPLFR